MFIVAWICLFRYVMEKEAKVMLCMIHIVAETGGIVLNSVSMKQLIADDKYA